MSGKLFLSIIIPTRNRVTYLMDTLSSLIMGYSGQLIEVLVIDNGSSDGTAEAIAEFAKSAPFRCHYHFAPCPGLHVGRNLGMQLAKGEILAYLDDDVFISSGWIDGVIYNFSTQPDLALLGGPCLPRWEVEPPSWVESFKVPCGKNGWVLWPLSLVNYADTRCVAPGGYILGCNYCVRKKVAQAAGGFHPDGVPSYLLKYRGDGETGMAIWIDGQDFMICYDPQVMVEHRISKNRLTFSYFRKIYQRKGLSDGYTLARKNACIISLLLKRAIAHIKYTCADILRAIKFSVMGKSPLPLILAAYANAVCAKHLLSISVSKKLQQWVLQKKYFIDDPCAYWKK